MVWALDMALSEKRGWGRPLKTFGVKVKGSIYAMYELVLALVSQLHNKNVNLYILYACTNAFNSFNLYA